MTVPQRRCSKQISPEPELTSVLEATRIQDVTYELQHISQHAPGQRRLGLNSPRTRRQANASATKSAVARFDDVYGRLQQQLRSVQLDTCAAFTTAAAGAIQICIASESGQRLKFMTPTGDHAASPSMHCLGTCVSKSHFAAFMADMGLAYPAAMLSLLPMNVDRVLQGAKRPKKASRAQRPQSLQRRRSCRLCACRRKIMLRLRWS